MLDFNTSRSEKSQNWSCLATTPTCFITAVPQLATGSRHATLRPRRCMLVCGQKVSEDSISALVWNANKEGVQRAKGLDGRSKGRKRAQMKFRVRER